MDNPENNKKNYRRTVNNYARFTGIAFQMAGIIAAGSYFGVYLDDKCSWHFPIFTVILSLLSVFAAIYLAIKDVMKMNK